MLAPRGETDLAPLNVDLKPPYLLELRKMQLCQIADWFIVEIAVCTDISTTHR